MPIYEYTCNQCEEQFELIVNASTTPMCPDCGSEHLTKELSVFSAGSSEAKAPAGGGGCCPCGNNPGQCGLN